MSTPPLFLAACALFWGWHAGFPAAGLALAVVLEAPRFVAVRWAFQRADVNRVADVCNITFLIVAVSLSFVRGLPIPVLEIFLWLPMVLLPLLLTQLFSERGRIDPSALFLTARKREAPEPGSEAKGVDLSYVYAAVCVIAAGTANKVGWPYYVGLVMIAAWALSGLRMARYPFALWALLLGCAAGLGYVGQIGLHKLQETIMESAIGWLAGSGARTDPNRSTTDIGHIGELKLSNRIAFRVRAPAGLQPPFLLHRASYDGYAWPSWVARSSAFASVSPAAGGSSWILRESGSPGAFLEISHPLYRGKAVLALPNGVVRIDQLPADELRRNRLGAVEVSASGERVVYRAAFDPLLPAIGESDPADLRVPILEAPAIHQVIEALRLRGRPPQESIALLRAWFARTFQYSTSQAPRESAATTPLAAFLLKTRAGHCEYFATATVMLLRALDIPARYATGFSVQEWSELEGLYIARERHAHAWVRAQVDGRWIDVDTTPPEWFATEQSSASSTWQAVSDRWSWLIFQFERWQDTDSNARLVMAAALVAPLVLFLLWRMRSRGGIERVRPLRGAGEREAVPRPGADSEFYLVASALARGGLGRMPVESLEVWMARIARQDGALPMPPLRELLALHVRYRFDPAGLSAAERARLRQTALEWLAAWGRTASTAGSVRHQ